jgi:hypothetical protein
MADNLVGVAAGAAYLHLHLFDVDNQTRKNHRMTIGFHGTFPVICNGVASNIALNDCEGSLYQYRRGFPMTIKQVFPVAVGSLKWYKHLVNFTATCV